jgi:hypothetical protein
MKEKTAAKIVALLPYVLAVIGAILLPLLVILAINTLLPSIDIAYGFKQWAAVTVLWVLAKASINVSIT